MGATILAAQVKPLDTNISLGVAAPSHFQKTVERVFGEFPMEFNEGHLVELDTLGKAWGDEPRNPWEQIAELVRRLGTVRVWAEY